MARTIRKYNVPIGQIAGQLSFDMPVGSKVRAVGEQHGCLCLWCEVDPSGPMCRRTFRVAGTGHDIGAQVGDYLGTAFFDEKQLVVHVFEMPR